MTAEAKEVLTPADIDSALVSLKGDRSAGLFVISDPMIYNNRLREIAAWAVENQRPATCDLREFVQVGGLMSYGANMAELARRGASYVDKILKGAKPADLPVEQPTKFDLVINLKTAQALGLTIPSLQLMRADELIE
jgi:putative ABC transport system substrate-binding protein